MGLIGARLVVATASALLAGCHTWLLVEADAPGACVTVHEIAIEGARVGVSGAFRRRIELQLDPGVFGADGKTTLAAAFASGRLASLSGARLDRLEVVEVWAIDRQQPEQEQTALLAGYRRQQDAESAAEIELTPMEPVDVIPFLHENRLALELAITGTTPEEPLLVDATACFSVAARVQLDR